MKRLMLVTALAAVLASWIAAPPAHAAAFKVVVHASNPVRALSAEQASNLFLKKVSRWNDGSQVEPVDLSDGSSVREAFSRDVHGKSVGAIKSYWQKMIFSGRATPPPELSNDAEIVAFVRSNPGAIGYVSASASVGSGLAEVEIGN